MSINQKKQHKMKKLFFLFLLGLSIVLASSTVFAQAEVSHGFKQDIKVSTNKGGPVLIKQGDKKILAFVPSSGTVNFIVKYKVGRRYVDGSIQRNIYDGKVFIPASSDANVEQPSTSNATTNVSSVTKMQSQSSDDDYSPEVGQVNYINNLTADIPSFHLRLKNEAKSIGEILFIGSVFTGVAAPPTGDTIISREKVRPGLTEMTVIYKMAIMSDGPTSGQQFTLAQQALAFFVTDPEQVITINDNDFFNFSSLAADLPIRFKNVGSVTLYPKSGNKKLKPLRKGRISKSINFESAQSTMWYYYDAHNVQRLAVWEIVPGDKPLIRIRRMDKLYGTAR